MAKRYARYHSLINKMKIQATVEYHITHRMTRTDTTATEDRSGMLGKCVFDK